jgi:hypothetical protein
MKGNMGGIVGEVEKEGLFSVGVLLDDLDGFVGVTGGDTGLQKGKLHNSFVFEEWNLWEIRVFGFPIEAWSPLVVIQVAPGAIVGSRGAEKLIKAHVCGSVAIDHSLREFAASVQTISSAFRSGSVGNGAVGSV